MYKNIDRNIHSYKSISENVSFNPDLEGRVGFWEEKCRKKTGWAMGYQMTWLEQVAHYGQNVKCIAEYNGDNGTKARGTGESSQMLC